jgi:hypothetical protein
VKTIRLKYRGGKKRSSPTPVTLDGGFQLPVTSDPVT